MRYSFLYFTAVKVVENPVRVSNYFSRVQLLFDNRRMMHQPESSAFAWGPEISSTMSAESTTESPFKRRRTTTHRYIEQDLQEAIEMDVKRRGPTRRNRTKTWPNSEPRWRRRSGRSTRGTFHSGLLRDLNDGAHRFRKQLTSRRQKPR